jgi:Rrf2 family protein
MMKISTRGRYALRLMLDLAQHQGDGFVSLKEVSERQEITVRYLEQIIAILLKAGFVQSFRGKSGGYRLTRQPHEYTTKEILQLTEGALLSLSCLSINEASCPRSSHCATISFWQGLQNVMENYLESVTLEDLLNQQKPDGCDYGAGI